MTNRENREGSKKDKKGRSRQKIPNQENPNASFETRSLYPPLIYARFGLLSDLLRLEALEESSLTVLRFHARMGQGPMG